MPLRMLLALLLAGAVFASPRPLPAQVRAEKTPNAEHERMKIEAEQAYQQGNYQQTIDLNTRVLAQNANDDVALYLRGSARVELGLARGDTKLVRSGIEDARNALRIGGKENISYYLPYLHGMSALATIENRAQHAQVVVDVASEVIKRSGLKAEDKANTLFQRAAAYVFLKNFEAAVADYQQAIRLVPVHLGAHVGLAEAYVAAGNQEKAREAFTRTTVAFPKNPLVYNQRGMYLQKQGLPQEAIVDFTKAIELDPNFLTAYTNRGFTLMNSGDPQAALGDFTAALRLDQNQPLVHSLRGTAYLMLGNLNQAAQDYSSVIRLDAKHAIAHADLGFARFFARDYRGALTAFDKAVELDAALRYLDPWRFWAMTQLGDADGARRKFASSLGNSASPNWIASQIRFLAGEFDAQRLVNSIDAMEEPQRQAQLCEAHYFIGRKLADTGQAAAAMQHFQSAVATKMTHLSAFRGAQLALASAGTATTGR